MQATDTHHLELILLFIVALIVVLAALTSRFKTPYPIVPVFSGPASSTGPR